MNRLKRRVLSQVRWVLKLNLGWLVLPLLATGCSGVMAPANSNTTHSAGTARAQPGSGRMPHTQLPVSAASTSPTVPGITTSAQVAALKVKFRTQGCGTFGPGPEGLPGFTCEFGNQFTLPSVSVTVWGDQATQAAHTSATDSTQVVIQSGDVIVLLQARKGTSEASQIAGLVFAAIGGKVVS